MTTLTSDNLNLNSSPKKSTFANTVNTANPMDEPASAAAEKENRQSPHQRPLVAALQQYWGFSSFRPLQLDAMHSVLEHRDSVVVFPTGGGKSLCFQAPAVCAPGLGVVVSPLISLMKDQVDALRTCGIEAAVLNSSLSRDEEDRVLNKIRLGELQLLYLAPERLLTDRCHALLATSNVNFFAIDEAHCVSEWGHDFRPEYRGLSVLKQRYPGVGIHAYTATATEQVRNDIVHQLGLNNPQVLVGSMDRPNLNYQIRPRQRGMEQITEVLNQHRGESGIVYCISRRAVESTAASLNALGFSTLPYHAGLSAEERKNNQNAFLQEKVDIIVATVAFGMGIDKSNVRFVIHASLPKSVEAYQQESGRAGRDGLDAECWLFHNGGDFVSWKRLIEQNDSGTGRENAVRALQAMSQFANGIQCRHVALAAHFGEQLDADDCGACDVCLNELDLVDDPLILAQKIVSCVYRVDQRFGADYVAQVLTGSRDKRILQNSHDQVSTYGLLGAENKKDIRTWIEQLVAQDYLAKVGEYNVLNITDSGSSLLRGEAQPRLTKATEFGGAAGGSNSKSTASWEGVDRDLFEKLRTVRAEIATRNQVPAYTVFSDTSLRDMARRRPSTLDAFRMINGVGSQKLENYGAMFVQLICDHCESNQVAMDVKPTLASASSTSQQKPPTQSALVAFALFDQGLSVDAVAEKLGRAVSTTNGYLSDYIGHRKITDPSRWVQPDVLAKVTEAIKQLGVGPLKPIFVALDEQVSYDDIRVVMECCKNS